MASPPGGTPSAPGAPRYIGRYRVLERIGRGAMGAVYAALDEQLGRRVAVKVMLGNFDDEPDMRERFYREARITGQLAHRNIVTVFDLGDDGGRPYLVMELLDALPLAEYLRTPAAQSLDAKIDLMMQICDGLQSAHRSGVIHRDVKPSNLLVQHDGTLRILDFGVARLTTSSLTGSGFLVGTPEYMSPEQTVGKRVDARSDLFSAAAVFYFMLTGRSPFGSRDLQRMLRAILHDEPAPLTQAEAPEGLRRVLARAMAKQPDDRYPDCAALLDELDRIRRQHQGATYRIAQAALERYRQILAVIEQRRALGRSLGIPNIDQTCDEAAARLRGRFPAFAMQPNTASLIEPMDRAVATAALEALQTRHNAELAALAALREGAADKRRTEGRDSGPDRGSLKDRAAAFWRGLSGE